MPSVRSPVPEADRQPGRRADAQRGATAGVAVHLRQHQPGDRQLGVERLGDAHRLLAGHGIDDEERLGRGHRPRDADELVHHRLVDVEAAGRVEDQDVHAARLGGLQPRPGDLERRRADGAGVDLDADLVAELHELVDGRRPIDVRRDQQRPLAVLAEADRQLRGGRGLARAPAGRRA